MVRLAYGLTGDLGHAEDLAQSAFTRAYASWPRVRRSGDPNAYVRKIMINENRNRFRKHRVTERLTEHGTVDLTWASDERSALIAALQRLGPRQRAVIVLRYWMDMTEPEAFFGTWLKPGQRGLARASGVLFSGQVSGHSARVSAYQGPWGICIKVSGGADMVSCGVVVAAAQDANVACWTSGTASYFVAETSAPVTRVVLTVPGEHIVQVKPARVGGRKLYAFAFASPGTGENLNPAPGRVARARPRRHQPPHRRARHHPRRLHQPQRHRRGHAAQGRRRHRLRAGPCRDTAGGHRLRPVAERPSPPGRRSPGPAEDRMFSPWLCRHLSGVGR
jgi:Sigma-70 region 2